MSAPVVATSAATDARRRDLRRTATTGSGRTGRAAEGGAGAGGGDDASEARPDVDRPRTAARRMARPRRRHWAASPCASSIPRARSSSQRDRAGAVSPATRRSPGRRGWDGPSRRGAYSPMKPNGGLGLSWPMAATASCTASRVAVCIGMEITTRSARAGASAGQLPEGEIERPPRRARHSGAPCRTCDAERLMAELVGRAEQDRTRPPYPGLGGRSSISTVRRDIKRPVAERPASTAALVGAGGEHEAEVAVAFGQRLHAAGRAGS